MKESTKTAIEQALRYARLKHPEFTAAMGSALLIAQEEMGEAIQAYNNNDRQKVIEELSHTAAVIVRILNGEFLCQQTTTKS